MSENKTEEITLEEYEARCKQKGRTIPVVKVEAVASVYDKDGNLKSTIDFSSEDLKDAT